MTIRPPTAPYRLGPHLEGLLLHIVLSIFFTWPLLLNLGSDTLVPGVMVEDRAQNLWNLWWTRVALLEEHTNPFFTDMIWYPTPVSLQFHTLNVFNGIISIPLQYFMPLTAIYSLIVLFSFFMAGWGAYLLVVYVVERWCMERDIALTRPALWAAATVGSVVFAYSAFHIATQRGQLQMISLEWVPFYALFLLRSVHDWPLSLPRAEWRRWLLRGALPAAGFLLLVALVDWYFTMYMLLFSVFYGSYLLARGLIARRERHREWWPYTLALALRLGVPVVLFFLLVSPMLVPMLIELSQTSYMKPAVGYAAENAADLLAFFMPPRFQQLWGGISQFRVEWPNGGQLYEVYFGYIALIVAAVGLSWRVGATALTSHPFPAGAGEKYDTGSDADGGAVEGIGAIDLTPGPSPARRGEQDRAVASTVVNAASPTPALPKSLSAQERGWGEVNAPIPPAPPSTVTSPLPARGRGWGLRPIEPLPSRLFWAVLVLIFFGLALGPVLQLNGVEIESVPMPYNIIERIPGFNISRSPDRFDMPLTLCLAVLVGYGTLRLAGLVATRGRATIIAAALVALMAVELWPVPYIQQPVTIPRYYSELGKDTDDYAILELPKQDDYWHGAFRMWFQIAHHKRIFGGYISREFPHPFLTSTPGFQELEQQTLAPDIFVTNRDEWLTAMQQYDTRLIVLYTEKWRIKTPVVDYDAYRAIIKSVIGDDAYNNPVHVDEQLEVYHVPPPSQKVPYMSLGRDWYPLEYGNDGGWRWMRREATVNVTTPEAFLATLVFSADSFAKERRMQVSIGGQAVGELTLTPGLKEYRVPGLNIPLGTSEISLLALDKPESPEQYGMGRDSRGLSFQIRQVRLER